MMQTPDRSIVGIAVDKAGTKYPDVELRIEAKMQVDCGTGKGKEESTDPKRVELKPNRRRPAFWKDRIPGISKFNAWRPLGQESERGSVALSLHQSLEIYTAVYISLALQSFRHGEQTKKKRGR